MIPRAVPALLLALLVPSAVAGAPPQPRGLGAMTPLGRAPADLALDDVTIVLGLRDRPGLEAAIAAQQDPRSPTHGQWLDATAIADRFGPRREHYERVRRWLVAQGLRITHDSPYRLAVSVAGTVALADAAFRTSLGLYAQRGRTYRAPSADPVLPPELAVRGVLGLDDLPTFHPLIRLAAGRTVLAPADLATVYGASGLRTRGFTGAGRTIAVIARSNFDDADVQSFAQQFARPAPRLPVRVLAVAGADPGVLADAREEAEVLLDTQWAGALAPQAQVNVVIAVPADAGGGDIPQALRAAVEQRAGDVISLSFGLCEPDTRPVTSELFDALYAIANAQGQTVLVAAGDDGATDCSGGDLTLAVNALAASPHAVAVGGTSLDPLFDGTGTATGYGSESVWDDAAGAGGGGQSTRFGRPAFQLGLGFAGRVLPDLALAASPELPGYVIVQHQAALVVGGTSASTPALASLLALVDEAGGTHGLGQLLPALYRLGAAQAAGTHAPVFRDVTTGTNGGFPAHPGFDLATGWGSPIVDALAGALSDIPAGLCDRELDCMVPARGSRRRACLGEWRVEHANPTRVAARGGYPLGAPAAAQRCRDGDADCDADRVADGTCTVRVALCLAVADARARTRRGRLLCEPKPARRVRLVAPRARSGEPALAGDREALAAAIAALLATPTGLRDACTAPVAVAIPTGMTVTLAARVRTGRSATARVDLTCIP